LNFTHIGHGNHGDLKVSKLT